MNTTPRLVRPQTCLLMLGWLLGWLAPPPLPADDWIYRIQSGETLSVLRSRFLLPEISVAQLQAYNRITEDRAIPVGAEIRFPLTWLKRNPASTRILFLQGDVSLYRDNVRIQPEIDLQLLAGDRILTGTQASVTLAFADGSRLLLGPASEITLDVLTLYGATGLYETRLYVPRGRVENRVEPLDKGSRYQIRTPAAVTLVRGTGFRMAVAGDSELTRSEVVTGRVGVTAAGQTVSVSGGYGTLVEPGQPPAPARKLLEPPDLSGLPDRLSGGSMRLSWPPLEGAESYRLMLLKDTEEEALMMESVEVESTHEFTDLAPGRYRLRLRGIDALGLEGLAAQHRLQVDAPAAQPPSVGAAEPESEPEPETVVPEPVLDPPRFGPGWMSFQWRAVAGVQGYRLRLARDPEFRDILYEHSLVETRMTLPMHWQGRVFVQVEGLFSDPDRVGHSGIYRLELPRR